MIFFFSFCNNTQMNTLHLTLKHVRWKDPYNIEEAWCHIIPPWKRTIAQTKCLVHALIKYMQRHSLNIWLIPNTPLLIYCCSWQCSPHKTSFFHNKKMTLCAISSTACQWHNIFSNLSRTLQTLIYPPRHICPMWQWLQNGRVWEERPSVRISPFRSIHQPPGSSLPGGPAFSWLSNYLSVWLTDDIQEI